jgi:Rap1a immunity proteins
MSAGYSFTPFSAAILAINLAATSSAGSFFKDGNDIYLQCAAPTGDTQRGICLGYIEGIADAMERNATNGWELLACIPANVRNTQLRDVVTQYLWANPAKRHWVASGLIIEALSSAFPCR